MQNKIIDTADVWLEQALRAEGVEHRSTYVADDGFTSRVMARLPEPATLPAWRRPMIALLWVCAAAVAVLVIPGLFDDAFRGVVAILVGHRIGVADIVGLLAVFSVSTWAVLIYAARTD